MAKSVKKSAGKKAKRAPRAETEYNKFVREYAALCAAERREYTMVGAAEAWERKQALARARARITKDKSVKKHKKTKSVKKGKKAMAAAW